MAARPPRCRPPHSGDVVPVVLVVLALALGGCARPLTAAPGLTEHPAPDSLTPAPVRASAPPAGPATLPGEVAASCDTDGVVRAVAVVGDAAYLAGDFETVGTAGRRPVARRNIAACDLATGAVLDWYPPGGADGTVLDLAVAGPWVYVAGEFSRVGGHAAAHVARLDAGDGRADVSWTPEPDGVATMVAPAPSGDVYVGGPFSRIAGRPQSALARIRDDGALDRGFTPRLRFRGGPRPAVWTVVEAGRHLFVGGRFSAANDEPRASAAAIDVTTGTTTHAFAPDLRDTNPDDLTVEVARILLHDDAAYLCGDFWQIEGSGSEDAQRNVGRFDPVTGAADDAWAPTTDGGVQDCALADAAGALLIGGHYLLVNGEDHQKLAALSLRDGGLRPWRTANGAQGVWALAVLDDGVVVGGAFDRVDDVATTGFAVLTRAGRD